MAFIQNNNGPINIEKQLNVTNTPPNTQGEQKQEGSKEQLSIRQVVIMMTDLLGIGLSSDTNYSELARLISKITGYSYNSIRQTIIEYSQDKKGTQTKRDSELVASLIEQFNPDVARKIRNGVDF